MEKKKLAGVTKDTNVAELIKKYPQSAKILFEYGLHCVGCFANIYDTIESGAKAHGLTDDDIKEIVEKINASI